MLRPPSLKYVPRYPVTAGIALASIVVTALWWSGKGIEAFEMNEKVWEKWELWRAFTSTLPHVSIFHLAFNLYWFWTFGTLVERVYGHFRAAGIFLLLAFGSMLAEFTLFSGGVGLSGVGYGLWGMMWALERRDSRFADAVDANTSRTFVAWFFLCIALTVTKIMPVANMAHGVGAVMGALLGWAASGNAAEKWNGSLTLVLIVVLGLLGSTVFWPTVNLVGAAEEGIEQAGLEALDRRDNEYAVKCLEMAVQTRRAPARAWYNLGVAYQRQGRYQPALAAFRHAAAMPDATSKMREIVQGGE